MGQKKKHLIFGILTEFQVFLAHIFVKIGGGCGIRTHVTGTVKQFSSPSHQDTFAFPFSSLYSILISKKQISITVFRSKVTHSNSK